MIVICKPYDFTVCRTKKPYPNMFDFRLNIRYGVKTRHKRLQYFGESYKRFDKKINKISFHSWKRSLHK